MPASLQTRQLAAGLLSMEPVYEMQTRAAIAAIRFARRNPWKTAALVAAGAMAWALFRQKQNPQAA